MIIITVLLCFETLWWFREGSRKVQGRFREGSERVQRRFRDGSGMVQGRFRDGSGTVQGRFSSQELRSACLFSGTSHKIFFFIPFGIIFYNV